MVGSRYISGFTLIELSIVLVIIGLLAGGILVGRDLIRASELRGDITELEKINTAVNAFQLKYNCLPGDCATATNFFSGAHNGGGNGMIDFWTNQLQYYATEFAYFAEHLAYASLVTLPPFDADDPAAALNRGLLRMKSADAGMQVGCHYNPDLICHHARLGLRPEPSGANLGLVSDPPIYTPSDAYYIDSKIDDGLPLTGAVNSVRNFNVWNVGHMGLSPPGPIGSGVCVSNAVGNPYEMTENRLVCGLKIKMGF